MHLKLFSNSFSSIDEMVACGIKHAVLADTSNHPFVVDFGNGEVNIQALYGVVRFFDTRKSNGGEYKEKEVTATKAIRIITKSG